MHETMPRTPLVIVIPSVGRREILSGTIRALKRQERLPDQLIVSITSEDDLDRTALNGLPFPVEVTIGPKGLCAQRNRGHIGRDMDDIILHLDDDFLMCADYLSNLERLFLAYPDVVSATGTVAADGVVGPGFSHEEGEVHLAAITPDSGPESLTDIYNGYGCNFAYRAAPVLSHGLEFDEELPLYAWLEDVDFSRQLAPFGRIVRSSALNGVHLGTKTGRTPGLRLGYSQMANPIYLMGKKTMTPARAMKIMFRNFLSNLVYSLRPRAWTDSRGRLRGNMIALGHLMTGRLSPGRARALT